MGDITLIQLLDNARRQRDADAARQWTTSDWLALPVVAVAVLVIVAWVLVAGVANAIRGLFVQPVVADSCITYVPQSQHACGLYPGPPDQIDPEEHPSERKAAMRRLWLMVLLIVFCRGERRLNVGGRLLG